MQAWTSRKLILQLLIRLQKMKDDKAATEKMNKVIVKKVRPWVKFSLSLSALVMTYACARQIGLL